MPSTSSAPPAATAAELLALARAWAVAQFGAPPLYVTVHLPDGTNHLVSGRRHTDDFRSVIWDDVTYHFSESQAAIVHALWDAIPLGGDLGKRALLAAADSAQTDVRAVFKVAGGDMHPAWKTMIVEGRTQGTYRLAD